MNIPDYFGRRGASREPSVADETMPMPRIVGKRLELGMPYGKDSPFADSDNLQAVAAALDPTQPPAPIPNSKDAVVQAFLDVGKSVADAMRKAGDLAFEQGQRRKDEYYNAATVAERKAEYQAREAGEYIDAMRNAGQAIAPKPSGPTILSTPPLYPPDTGSVVVTEDKPPEPPQAA